MIIALVLRDKNLIRSREFLSMTPLRLVSNNKKKRSLAVIQRGLSDNPFLPELSEDIGRPEISRAPSDPGLLLSSGGQARRKLFARSKTDHSCYSTGVDVSRKIISQIFISISGFINTSWRDFLKIHRIFYLKSRLVLIF